MTAADVMMEKRKAIGELLPSSCFGHYLETSKACSNCQIAKHCVKTTERVRSGSPPPAPGHPEPKTVPAPDAKEYLLTTLRGKFDMSASREGDVQTWKFHKDGKPAFWVMEKGGRLGLQTRKGREVLELPSSVVEVEAALERLL